MKTVVVLLTALAVDMIRHSDALSCYECTYGSLNPEDACAEPYDGARVPKCNGLQCLWGYGSYNNWFGYYRTCFNFTILHVDQCQTYNSYYEHNNVTFYVYGSSCCYKASVTAPDGTSVTGTYCFCEKDNCNSNPFQQEPSKNFKPLNVGFSLQPVGRFAVLVVALITLHLKFIEII